VGIDSARDGATSFSPAELAGTYFDHRKHMIYIFSAPASSHPADRTLQSTGPYDIAGVTIECRLIDLAQFDARFETARTPILASSRQFFHTQQYRRQFQKGNFQNARDTTNKTGANFLRVNWR
jgi:hypothetical protein